MALSILTLQQGIRSGYGWPIVDAAGEPADLSGWTARAQVRQQESHTSELLADLSAAVEGSMVTVRWTAAESREWTWMQGYCDVLLVDPDGESPLVVWQGMAVVDRVVTDV